MFCGFKCPREVIQDSFTYLSENLQIHYFVLYIPPETLKRVSWARFWTPYLIFKEFAD